jgi:uncharacterized membrane protein YkvA (DUF1232 family)
MTLKERAQSLKRDIPAVFLALKDKDTPISAKVLAGITVCYALSPVDLIPDFIPVLGYLDDLILLPALIALTVKLIPGEVWERNRARSEHLWETGKMVFCNPNLPDLAADSVAGRSGSLRVNAAGPLALSPMRHGHLSRNILQPAIFPVMGNCGGQLDNLV